MSAALKDAVRTTDLAIGRVAQLGVIDFVTGQRRPITLSECRDINGRQPRRWTPAPASWEEPEDDGSDE